jgi:NADH:ubiquinone oxidoreductase subunit 2 (subunit N)
MSPADRLFVAVVAVFAVVGASVIGFRLVEMWQDGDGAYAAAVIGVLAAASALFAAVVAWPGRR